MFHQPLAVFSGPELARAESLARSHQGWLAGGLEYGPAEAPGPGWWGVFSTVQSVDFGALSAWADPSPVRIGACEPLWSFEDYQAAFDEVRRSLAQGVSYQVNLTFPLTGVAVSGSCWSWRSGLRLWLELIQFQGREACFAVLGTPERPGPLLVSASPELFFRQEGNLVESRPMKGTASRSPDPNEDARAREELGSSPKTRAENLMVTDMVRHDLGRLAVPGGVSVPRLFEVEAYPSVWQMTSTVQATLPPNMSLVPLMAALFPCASITGAPKISTQQVIGRAEAQPRGWYTGTLGWYRPASPVAGPKRSRFSVLIRTLVFDSSSSRFTLGLGGGVVWDSTAPGEWAEALSKARFLDPARREFSLTEAVLWDPEKGLTLMAEHEARLQAACRAFGGDLADGVLGQALDDAVAGLRSSGLQGPMKLRALVDPEFRLLVEGEPLSTLPEVLTVALADQPLGPETLLWRRFKTTQRSIYDRAKVPGVDQTIHFNERGELTESTSMNLVLEIGGRLLTPATSSGLLEGTFRAHLLARGTLIEEVLPREALARADRIWLINSVRGWKLAKERAALAGGPSGQFPSQEWGSPMLPLPPHFDQH